MSTYEQAWLQSLLLGKSSTSRVSDATGVRLEGEGFSTSCCLMRAQRDLVDRKGGTSLDRASDVDPGRLLEQASE
jgi:hypothetical protein